MVLAVLALGSNLGDRLATLQAAVDQLAASPGVSVRAVSSVYETDPVGTDHQPDYLNAVVLAETTLSPSELLALAHSIEADLGRLRGKRWAARTLDIDIIDVAGVVSADPTLTLPHPRALERAFVLVPWVEIDAAATAADGRAAHRAVDEIDTSGVRRRAELSLQVPA